MHYAKHYALYKALCIMQSIIHYAKDYAGPKTNVYANQNTCKNGGGINRESIFFHLQKKSLHCESKKVLFEDFLP